MACELRFESELYKSGYRLIAGVNEVGRGSMAGPVVAAAVILNPFNIPDGIDDSKKLSRSRRARLEDEIMASALAFCVARVEHNEIDQINIHHASLLAMLRAVKALQPEADYVLIDGRYKLPNLECPQRPIIKGDCLSVSVAAASIIAKTARDRWMREYDEQYPGYGFASHVGYNTRAHQEAIAQLGPCPIHRLSFNGVLSYQAALDLREESPSLASLPESK